MSDYSCNEHGKDYVEGCVACDFPREFDELERENADLKQQVENFIGKLWQKAGELSEQDKTISDLRLRLEGAQGQTCSDAKEQDYGCFRAVRAERKLAEARKAMELAAQQMTNSVRQVHLVEVCDYTPAQSILLAAIASTEPQSLPDGEQ